MQVDRQKIRNYLNLQPANWYRITNLSDEEAEVFIYDEISFYGVTADQFVQDLQAIQAPKLTVRLNSPGGNVFDGIAIYNAIRQHPSYVTMKVDSLAASIASVIAQAGDRRLMMPKSQMMIHEAQGIMVGNAEELRKFSDLLDKQSDLIASIYAERSATKSEAFRELMRAETWLSDAEVIDLGLADEIAEIPNKTEPVTDKLLTQVTNTSDPIDWLSFMKEQEVLSVEGLI